MSAYTSQSVQRKEDAIPAISRARHSYAGKLAQIMSMPTDVFLQIASHLWPLDVLNLSRVSRRIRGEIYSNRAVWKSAFRNIEPPLRIPPDLCGPKYAHALFGQRTCEGCGAFRPTYTFYTVPVRLCDKNQCIYQYVGSFGELMEKHNVEQSFREQLLNLIPAVIYHDPRELSVEDVPVFDAVGQCLRDEVYELEFVSVLRRYRELQATPENAAALQGFVDRRKQSTLERLNVHREIVRWEAQVRINNKEHKDELAVAHRAAVEERLLRELGIGPSELPHENPQWMRIACAPLELTDRRWAVIRPQLRRIIDDERESQRQARMWEQRCQIDTYYSEFLRREDRSHEKSVLPGIAEARLLPHISSLYEAIFAGGPDVTPGGFAAIEAGIFMDAGIYEAKVGHDLVELLTNVEAGIQHDNKGKGTGVSVAYFRHHELPLLDVPTALFVCDQAPPEHKRTDCRNIFSFVGLREHWQRAHSADLWNPNSIKVAVEERKPENIARLLAALQLPQDATMASVEERVRSGRARCSCGHDCTGEVGRKRPFLMLSRIAQHVLDQNRHSSRSSNPQLDFKPYGVQASSKNVSGTY